MAQDLNLLTGDDPVGAILKYCERRIRAFEPPPRKCETLLDLLNMVAANVRTKFIIIESDDQLNSVCEDYLARGETVFATLKHEFASDRMYGTLTGYKTRKGGTRHSSPSSIAAGRRLPAPTSPNGTRSRTS
jgi:hypothetical protein